MGLACRQGDRNLVGTRRDGVGGSPEIGDQRQHREARNRAGVGHYFGRIRHLRQDLRRDERAHLDFPDPGGGFRRNPRLLGCRRHAGLDALQAVSRTYFTHQNVNVVRACHAVVLCIEGPYSIWGRGGG